jgi:hypothetical protein
MAVGKFSRRFLDFANRLGEFWIDKDNIENQIKKSFDHTKAISDFIGMILRFGFALAASLYFLERTKSGVWYEPYIFGVCFTMSMAITLALGSGIGMIIFSYEMRAVGDSKRTFTRWAFVAIAVYITICLWFGVNDLARVIGGTLAKR